MCRVYKSKRGSYVRLCYRFGSARGDHIYFRGEKPPLGPSGHYTGEPISSHNRKWCKHSYEFNTYCGCYVCILCGDHKGRERCFCGWSLTSPGRGREELEEMGEIIEPWDY